MIDEDQNEAFRKLIVNGFLEDEGWKNEFRAKIGNSDLDLTPTVCELLMGLFTYKVVKKLLVIELKAELNFYLENLPEFSNSYDLGGFHGKDKKLQVEILSRLFESKQVDRKLLLKIPKFFSGKQFARIAKDGFRKKVHSTTRNLFAFGLSEYRSWGTYWEEYLATNGYPVLDHTKNNTTKILPIHSAAEYLKHQWGNEPLVNWPSMEDLRNPASSELYIDTELLNKLLSHLAQRQILVLAAPGGRGKTVIARLLASKFFNTDSQVYFIDLFELNRKLTSPVLEDISNRVSQKHATKHVFVIENTHSSDIIASIFVRFIRDQINRNSSTFFILTTRDYARHGTDDVLDPFKRWKREGILVNVDPGFEYILGIISRFINSNNFQYQISGGDKEWVNRNFTSKGEDDGEAKRFHGNLRLLRLYLNAWDYEVQKLTNLVENDILNDFARFIHSYEGSGRDAISEDLARIASINQFDVPYLATRRDDISTTDWIDRLQSLREKGRIRKVSHLAYAYNHSVDAYYFALSLARLNNTSYEEFTAHHIVQYFSNLKGTQPKEIINENIRELLSQLLTESFEKENLFIIIQHVLKSFLDEFIDFCSIYELDVILAVLNLILLQNGKANSNSNKDKAWLVFKASLKKMGPEKLKIKLLNADPLIGSKFFYRIGSLNKEEYDHFFTENTASGFLDSGDFNFVKNVTYFLSDEMKSRTVELIPHNRFAESLIETGTVTNVNFFVDIFQRTEEGKRFLEELFETIRQHYYAEYRNLYLINSRYRNILRNREHLSKHGRKLRLLIDNDVELRRHITNVRRENPRISDGIVVIEKDDLKALMRITSRIEFLTKVNQNIHRFSKVKTSFSLKKKFLIKLIRTCQQDSDSSRLGKEIVRIMTRSLEPWQLKEAAKDHAFFKLLYDVSIDLHGEFIAAVQGAAKNFDDEDIFQISNEIEYLEWMERYAPDIYRYLVDRINEYYSGT